MAEGQSQRSSGIQDSRVKAKKDCNYKHLFYSVLTCHKLTQQKMPGMRTTHSRSRKGVTSIGVGLSCLMVTQMSGISS